MCKKIVIAAIVSICLVFTGCSAGQPKEEEKQINVKETGRQEKNNTKADNTLKEKENTKNNNLQLLCKESMRFMSEAGYYYITADSKELKGDLWGRHIMYMDFATKQEVYLCAEPGCKHNDKKCTAVLPEAEFGGEPLIFVCNDTLYVVSRNSNQKGSSTVVFWEDESNNSLIGNGIKVDDGTSEMPVVLYSMGLDGTNRTKEYTFEQDINLDSVVLYDGKDLYFVANKTNISSDKNTTYHTTSDCELVKYQTKDSKLANVCSLEFGDNVRWNIVGCYNNNVILQGRKYNGNLTFEEQMKLENEEGWEYENDSKDMYVKLDLTQESIKEVYSIENDPNSSNGVQILGDYLYVSQEKTGTIEKVDMETGKIQNFATLKQSAIFGSLSNKLCCGSWEQGDETIYFADVNSGKIDHCTLVNHYNGEALKIIGETGNQVLVIYDWDAEEVKDLKGQDAWEVKRYQYGLINKTDLYQSKDCFEKIEMKGTGE
ncbi:MAG: hypothetical protein K2N51_14755 [Lachnospiraceae bacterium]|nr:hypothetical protein [Lachnospiraceae bacterium]